MDIRNFLCCVCKLRNHRGATVDFVDVDPDTVNICLDALEKNLERLKKGGSAKILVVVHMCGSPADKIHELSVFYKLK